MAPAAPRRPGAGGGGAAPAGPTHKEALAGLDQTWRRRRQDCFLDVAGDGYVIASGPGLGEEEANSVRSACLSGGWRRTAATDCLGECLASDCACSRARNPLAREAFLETAARWAALAAKTGGQACHVASLGSGLLRADFCFLERLLALGVAVAAVHLVDVSFDPDSEWYGPHCVALAQFASWFSARGVDVFAHSTLEQFSLRVRQAEVLPTAVLQVDCVELTKAFDAEVKPMLEDVLSYGGVFCSLTAREAAAGATGLMQGGLSDAWGEVWRLCPQSGRLRLASRLRYRPGEGEREALEEVPRPPFAAGS